MIFFFSPDPCTSIWRDGPLGNFPKVFSFKRFEASRDISSQSVSSYTFCMDAYTSIFLPSSCFPVSLLKCKFCACVEEFDTAPQSHLSDIYYSGALFFFFFFGRAGVRSLSKSCSWPHAKLRLLSPKPCRTKASAYLKRWFQGEGGAFWILPLSWRCNQDCKSSSLNVKRCRVVSHTALLWFSPSQCLIKVKKKQN